MAIEQVRLHQKKEIELHRGLADSYQRRYTPEYSLAFQDYWNQEILKLTPFGKNKRVLDLGCGNGILLADLAKSFSFVVGVYCGCLCDECEWGAV